VHRAVTTEGAGGGEGAAPGHRGGFRPGHRDL
jgi:hypothetical protein